MNGESPILWIASGNKDKARELTDLAQRFLPNFNTVTAREPISVVESEPTFEGNARLKALALVAELLGEGYENFSVIADDSGLCVDLLEGRPGVLSGRYSGNGSNSRGNIEKVLSELAGVSTDLGKRTGYYHCSLYLISVANGVIIMEIAEKGQRRGLLAIAPMGSNGYAYDSVFLDPDTFLSYGEISYEEKQQDSHRTRAFQALKQQMARSSR